MTDETIGRRALAHELIEHAARCAGVLRHPKVRALHLPHPSLAGDKNGEFCAIELDDGSLGLSYVLLDDTLDRLRQGDAGGTLRGMDALSLAARYATGHGSERTLGFAAINALTRSLFDRAAWLPRTSTDSVGELDPGPDDHVGMIGFFRPLVSRITSGGGRLTVLELKAELVGEHDGFRVTLDPDELATCEKVLSTSTVLLNDTLDVVLAACGGARRLALIGPSAGCPPDPLFARGVSYLGGNWVVDREAFVAALTGGASWGQYARKVGITPADYPGLAALIERAGA